MKFVAALCLMAASAYASQTITCDVPEKNETGGPAFKATITVDGEKATLKVGESEGTLDCTVSQVTKESVEADNAKNQQEAEAELKEVPAEHQKEARKLVDDQLKKLRKENDKLKDTTLYSCYEDQSFIKFYVTKKGKDSLFGYDGGSNLELTHTKVNCTK